MDNKIKRQSFEAGAVWLIGAAIITKIIGAFFKIPLASDSCLGDIGFGYFSSFYDLLLPLWTLSISGFPVAISHFVALYAEKADNLKISQVLKCSKSFLIMVSLCLTAVLIVLYFPLSASDYSKTENLLCFLAILPSALLCGAVSYYRGYFEGFSNMRPAAISSLIEAFCKLFLGFGFAFFTIKLTYNYALSAAASLFGLTIGTVFSALFLRFFYNKNGEKNILKLTENTKIDKSLKRSIVVLSLTVAIASLSSGIITLIDTLTVRTVLDISVSHNSKYYFTAYSELIENAEISLLPTLLYGIKSKAHTVFNIFLTIAMAVGVTVVPALSGQKSKSLKCSAINTALRFISLFTFPIAGGFIAISKPIMTFLFGNSVSSNISGNLLAIYGFAVIFAGFSILLANVLQSLGKHIFVLKTIIFASTLKLVLNVLLCSIKVLNIYACAITTVVFYLVLFVLEISMLIKEGYLNSLKKVFLKPIFAGLISSMVAYFVTWYFEKSFFTVVAVALAAVINFAILIIFRFFLPSDFEGIPFLNKLINMFKKTKI